MNWQISQIEISSFKAFKYIHLDLGDSSLLTLDGPNGYGKTSIFDAIELLLTGQIKRIHDLFSTLMTKNKTNYDDNLFWNTRSGTKDLSIKIEFVDGARKLVLARYAPAKTFSTKTNNRADKFKHFKLYELPDFSSSDYSINNARDNQYLEEVFGVNFRENFSFLNYLEQGQNRLLHTRVDERKDALGNLFNISDIATEVESCKSILTKLTKFIGDDERKVDEENLKKECSLLRDMIQADLGSIEFKKLSTIEVGPGWDHENPFPTYSVEVHRLYIDTVQKISTLVPMKATIHNRIHNEAIETDIEKNKESFRSLVQFGVDLFKLTELENTKKELDQLEKANSIIKRGANVITLEEAQSLPGWSVGRLEWFEERIKERNNLQIKNTTNDNVAAELTHLKKQLIEEHVKLYPNDQRCPLCDKDWTTHNLMLNAVDERARKISESLSADGKTLVILITSMADELATIDIHVQRLIATHSIAFNRALHEELIKIKVRLPAIIQLAEELKSKGIQTKDTFSDNDEVIAERLERLSASLRARKIAETEALPDDWKAVINTAFKELQDFYIIDLQDLKNKNQYIAIKANEAQSARLQKCLEDLRKIERENEAALRAKDKFSRLRTTLEKAEQSYANQTISEIELIFHIYSGRLIQNYQRGLGLFIESKEGKQLRFLTAEKSDHDAVMSMSSGQVSALSLAFFLSLNKVYARVPLILIDDPSQSLDEVNVASLTDLLRCELKHCQLIVSSHEEDISSYMRYRFTRAGLSTISLNMQRLSKEVS
ncbi:AAA family ATPase [Salmonella enterica]|nr:recombinase RecF [Salmonella enterica subsp. houtenae]EBI0041820.1 recombinase RecF [Salmonella enterica subsp. diarizonae serovar 61:k:z35]EDU0973474.1 AAA family ATPase [Salmonella enterica subsp. arizonae serovar 38:z4,z23:-]EGS6569089.1 AAA family ATPase [Salmonella enterica]EIW3437723.1 AAA family ATPase [Salmonella enterica subsp. houtenae serovar 38:z4,z23:-]